MLHLIAVGRLRDGPEAELFARYKARLRPGLVSHRNRGGPRCTHRNETARGRGAAVGAARGCIRRRAGLRRQYAGQRRACPQPGTLAGDGPARLLPDRRRRRPGCTVLARADYVLSLGKLTWPHFARARDARRAGLPRTVDRRGASLSPLGAAIGPPRRRCITRLHP